MKTTTKGKAKAKATERIAAPEPDPRAAARKVLESDEERPERAAATSAERVRAYRARKKEAEEAAQAPLEVTPDHVAMATGLGAVVWDIVAPMGRLKPLDADQQGRLGRALAPLVVKYMPLLADWQYEVAAVMCVFALARENAIPKVANDAKKEVSLEAPTAASGAIRGGEHESGTASG